LIAVNFLSKVTKYGRCSIAQSAQINECDNLVQVGKWATWKQWHKRGENFDTLRALQRNKRST